MQRFWNKVRKAGDDECWLWTASIFKKTGYGQFHYKGRSQPAHRVSFLIAYGYLPDCDVCHSCDVRRCVNPRHLFPGTRLVNMQDAKSKGRMSSGDQHGSTVKRRVRGEDCGASKLTAVQVLEIQQTFKAERVSFRELGRRYGVSHHVISGIINRTRWTHITNG